MAEAMKLEEAAELDFDRETVEQAYDRWAPVYDLVFGGVFSKGRQAAIAATNKINLTSLALVKSVWNFGLPQWAVKRSRFQNTPGV